MSFFISLDEYLFRLINQVFTHPLLDGFFAFITNIHKQWVFLYVVLPVGIILWVREKKISAIKILFALTITAGLSDTLCYRGIKNWANRIRPNNRIEMQSQLRVEYGPKSPSMPSNHATTTMALMVLLGLYYPRWKRLYLAFAIIVGYSRVYVGVHFPGDVLVGFLLGGLLGNVLFKFLFSRWPGVFGLNGPASSSATA